MSCAPRGEDGDICSSVTQGVPPPPEASIGGVAGTLSMCVASVGKHPTAGHTLRSAALLRDELGRSKKLSEHVLSEQSTSGLVNMCRCQAPDQHSAAPAHP